MAFCPECGKAVTPDEAACSSCGKQLHESGKKARAGRFHGTMMMTAPALKKEPPANINDELQAAAAAGSRRSSPAIAVALQSDQAPEAPPSSRPPAQARELAQSERPPAVRQTFPQGSASPSVRAVQSMPVSPSADTQPAPPARPLASPALIEAKTVPSPLPARGAPAAPNPARMVQAIPEVEATVVDPNELPAQLQPPAATRRYPSLPPEDDAHKRYILLYWAVCVAVVAAACALAFRLF